MVWVCLIIVSYAICLSGCHYYSVCGTNNTIEYDNHCFKMFCLFFWLFGFVTPVTLGLIGLGKWLIGVFG